MGALVGLSGSGTMGDKRGIIVGLGASAGGVEALQGFFKALPVDSGMAFVVVTHLGPGRPSILPEIIARHASIPVAAAEDRQKIEADHVYVLAVDSVLTVKNGRLLLRAPEPGRRERNPIDIFFASLALEQAEDGIGIVLSGGGSDGTLGIKAIKERGGLTMAQGGDHSAPRHEGMPTSAIASGGVDIIASVEEMPGKLLGHVRSFDALKREGTLHPTAGAPEQGDPLAAIHGLLRRGTGHDFTGYKARTFLRRVHRRMQVLQVTSVGAYLERLSREPGEIHTLFRDLLIGVTGFFRDAEAFAELGQQVLPALIDARGADAVVRVWVPGCATGEEAYSLAMLIRERIAGRQNAPRVQIFATDIDERALAVARAGRYPALLVEGVSPERLARFFVHDGSTYTLNKEIRELCVFSPHSVIRDPPFSRIDLVSCRNLLIYLGAELQQLVTPVFHYALRPGGYLFLGLSENVTRVGELFQTVSKKQRIFRKLDRPGVPAPLPLLGLIDRAQTAGEGAGRAAHPDPLRLRQLVEGAILERFAPAHVVVNRDAEVLYFSARTGRFLEPPAGLPNRQLIPMTRRGIRLELQGALREAFGARRAVVREHVEVELEERVQPITLQIEPLSYSDEDPLFLVLFIEEAPPRPIEHSRRLARPDEVIDTQQLERDLRESRDRLQATIEEYETAAEELKAANEELVSINEELQSANEELESSKEEQQSVNEELQAVNVDLGTKVDELESLRADLQHLFDGTRIATVFLDGNLLIRSFTPAITAIFNLIPSDRGRPLTDIVTRLAPFDLSETIREVLARRQAIDQPVSLPDDRAHFILRVMPYRGMDDTVGGALLTFIDVTEITRAEQHQRLLVAELNHRVRNMLQVVSVVAAKSIERNASPEVNAARFQGRLHALADAYHLLSREEWKTVELAELVSVQLAPLIPSDAPAPTIEGCPIQATPKAALGLSTILHELATNAVKYGALSVATGRVAVRWMIEPGPDGDQLVLRWQESGGPEIGIVDRRGFGTELIERQVRYDLDGAVDLSYRPTGLEAVMTLPMGADLSQKGAPG